MQWAIFASVTIFVALVFTPNLHGGESAAASFPAFRAKAKAGKSLSVVFFGGSLTWGANATDPQRSSYRGRMMTWLQETYPTAAFRFHDAAIGGTGSDLAIFRLDRDVFAYDPDLVFLDFTANDGLDRSDTETLACYESLLRRMIGRGIPVVQVLFGFKWQFGKSYNLEKVLRRRDHLRLAQAYGTGVGDLYPYLQAKILDGVADREELWPFDGGHPGDRGYRYFFEAVRDGLLDAIREERVCRIPADPVFSDAFMHVKRLRLVETKLPRGWSRQKTYRTSLWFDGLSSRWMGDVAMCDAKDASIIEPLRIEFEGTLLGIFGEADEKGLPLRIAVDGQPITRMEKGAAVGTFPWSTARFGPKGNLFMWSCPSKTLTPGKHVVEIRPVIPEGVAQGQLRIESICTAGGALLQKEGE